MPSLLHEGLIALVRDKPEFAAELLRGVLHVNVPNFSEARLAEACLTELVPTEYHADAVVLLVDDKPVFGIIVEAQLQDDARKHFTWPMYTVSARARFECPFVLVVVTPDSGTARWASQSVELGGGICWAPLVIGPEGIPIVTDFAQARREPELTVLSAMAHGRGEPKTALAIADAARTAVEHLPEERRMLYLALVVTALGDAARRPSKCTPKTRSSSARQTGSITRRVALKGSPIPKQARCWHPCTRYSFHHERLHAIGCDAQATNSPTQSISAAPRT